MLVVGRFVKYTGYGNAAGLLAQHGLMCGGHGAVYSSESEDSETEEYSQLKDKYVIRVFHHTYISACICQHVHYSCLAFLRSGSRCHITRTVHL